MMIQTYPLQWIAEGLTTGFMAFLLWPLVMAYFVTWRLYKLSNELR